MLHKEIHMLTIKNGEIWPKNGVSGVPLYPAKVQAARQLEMEYFRNKIMFYNKVDRSHARGKKGIRTKWIDLKKDDSESPETISFGGHGVQRVR